MNKLPFCECGCGKRVTRLGNRFLLGHNWRDKKRSDETKLKMSEAKIGVPKPPRTPKHCANISAAHIGVLLSPEHCTAISTGKLGIPRASPAQIAADEAKRGVPHSPEWCDAISKGQLNSDKIKTSAKRQRGGNDICNHHYTYDHNDLSLNTVRMTRSDHMRLHQLLRKLGYIVPHINQ